jgi:hypothetical protein
MTITATNETATAAASIPSLPTGAWDLVSFLENAKDYGTILGGGVVTIIGLIILIAAVVFILKKFLGNGQGPEKSWPVIIIMIVVAGAFLTGGIGLMLNISSGGQKTIEELGGGFIVLQSSVGLLR